MGEICVQAKHKSSNVQSLKMDAQGQWQLGDVSDDVLVKLFCLLDIQSFFSINRTSTKFYNLLTSENNKVTINKYWESQSKRLCCNIDVNYQTKKWKQFYFELRRIFIHCLYLKNKREIHKIDKMTCRNMKLISGKSSNALFEACRYDCPLILAMVTAHHKIQLNSYVPRTGGTPLLLAIKWKSFNTIDYLLHDANVDINVSDNEARVWSTPLILACQKGLYQVVLQLLARGDITQKTIDYVTPPSNRSIR